MAGKRKSPTRRDWPTGVVERRGGYYSWEDPITGKEYGLGRDRRDAFRQAIEANNAVAGRLGQRSLLDRVNGIEDTTVARWITRYEEIQAAKFEKGDIRKDTLSGVRQRLRYVQEAWGPKKVEAVTTKDVAAFIRGYESAGKARMAQAYRSLLFDLFREAQAEGWVPANPVQPTKGISVEVQRARLTLDQFKAIRAYALEHKAPWVARSMELALVTGQRREDIREMIFPNIHEDHLWVEQGKTGNRVAIPTGLALAALGWSLAGVIRSCRDKVLSRHLLHHTALAGRAKPGDPIRPHTVTAEFADCRDKAGLTWDGKAPATFHEIRSLAARLYTDERGKEFAQALLGHKSAEMTALYRDIRGAEWVKVPL